MSTTSLAPAWRDNKRYLWPLGGVIMLLVPIAGVLYKATGWGGWWWLGPMVVYGLIPLADLLIGTDANNPPEERVPSLEKERYYRWAVYLAVACEYVSVIWGAWMAANGGGRFVNVSSGSAWGLVGGAVYGTAKMGVIGLTRSMAAEGREVGIAANVITPFAKTRPGTGMGPYPWSETLGEWLAPRKVAPAVGWLAHESCPANGECFTVGGGHLAKVTIQVTDGYTDREPTIESYAAHVEEIREGATSEITPISSRSFVRMFEGYPG